MSPRRVSQVSLRLRPVMSMTLTVLLGCGAALSEDTEDEAAGGETGSGGRAGESGGRVGMSGGRSGGGGRSMSSGKGGGAGEQAGGSGASAMTGGHGGAMPTEGAAGNGGTSAPGGAGGTTMGSKPPSADGKTSWWFEVEDGAITAPWALHDTTAGFTGKGYLLNTSTKTIQNSGGEMKFDFEVTAPGTYVATIRGRRDMEGACAGEASDQCNDVRTKWDGGSFIKTMVKGPWGQWIWQSQIEYEHGKFRQNATPLEAGRHSFHIGVRSKGVKVDVITIHLVGTARPGAPPE